MSRTAEKILVLQQDSNDRPSFESSTVPRTRQNRMDSVLVIGFGNPGRLDDGLGPGFAEELEKRNLPGVTVESNYQLAVEDALKVAEHTTVIFADAASTGPGPFEFKRIEPAETVSFTTHDVAPAELLGMAKKMFGSKAEGFVLGIRGYRFDEFGETLSKRAEENMRSALRFIEKYLLDRSERKLRSAARALEIKGEMSHGEK